MSSFTLETDCIQAIITNYGATLTHLIIKDKNGIPRDVVLGFDDPSDYQVVGENQNPYFGCIAGRTCNRTQLGRLDLNGKTYQLPINNGPNRFHSYFLEFSVYTVA